MPTMDRIALRPSNQSVDIKAYYVLLEK